MNNSDSIFDGNAHLPLIFYQRQTIYCQGRESMLPRHNNWYCFARISVHTHTFNVDDLSDRKKLDYYTSLSLFFEIKRHKDSCDTNINAYCTLLSSEVWVTLQFYSLLNMILHNFCCTIRLERYPPVSRANSNASLWKSHARNAVRAKSILHRSANFYINVYLLLMGHVAGTCFVDQ